jgi:hypothetical protein
MISRINARVERLGRPISCKSSTIDVPLCKSALSRPTCRAPDGDSSVPTGFPLSSNSQSGAGSAAAATRMVSELPSSPVATRTSAPTAQLDEPQRSLPTRIPADLWPSRTSPHDRRTRAAQAGRRAWAIPMGARRRDRRLQMTLVLTVARLDGGQRPSTNGIPRVRHSSGGRRCVRKAGSRVCEQRPE